MSDKEDVSFGFQVLQLLEDDPWDPAPSPENGATRPTSDSSENDAKKRNLSFLMG